MSDLLLELFSEEIPARMQQRAAEELRAKVTGALVDAGLMYEGAVAHVTPRRLCLHIAGLPVKSPDTSEEKKGPKVGAPEAAIAGFLKSAGLTSIDQAKIEGDAKKGQFYVASISKKGVETKALLAHILPGIIKTFSWPKSMRWGAASVETNSLKWVRPLHSILCTFGAETETPEIVEFEVGGIKSGDFTHGHRFMAPEQIIARRFEDYEASLEKAFVILNRERRKDIIRNEAKTIAFARGFELIEDEGLLDEVAGLVEWPVPLMGTFDKAFLELPEPVIRTTIRANQKCFVLRGADGKLTNAFILVANLTANDGGKAIIAGNERVVAARLSDAKFFFDQDKKVPLLTRAKKLDTITFHEKLGTQGERVARIAALAREIAPLVGAKPDEAELAAKLAKADLVTEMVGEFPELQGFMGRTYAKLEGQPEHIAAAIEEHYKPVGPTDVVPTNPVSIAVALADKIDTLITHWILVGKPTGSKDPFALRRTALGIFRIITENEKKLSLLNLFIKPLVKNAKESIFKEFLKTIDLINDVKASEFKNIIETPLISDVAATFRNFEINEAEKISEHLSTAGLELLNFIFDRLRGQLREQGMRHDIIDSVLALEGQDDLLLIVRRIEALSQFISTDNGAALQAGVTRALNILRIEEKKDAIVFGGNIDYDALKLPEEKVLLKAIEEAEAKTDAALSNNDFTAAMTALSNLRTPIDAFFDKVMVNEEPHRVNRLNLLARIRNATSAIADFSKLEGAQGVKAAA